MSTVGGLNVRGLPGPLPAGEQLLWQGAPCWRTLARRVFHIRKLALYFAVMLGWRIVSAMDGGIGAALASTTSFLVLALIAIGLLALLAWLIARTTVYTVTDRRVVMHFGVALPMSVNVPFRTIESAALRAYPDGSGDIPLALAPGERIGYVALWPHARPWRYARTQPMLRGVPDVERAARILARALAAAVADGAAQAPGEPREAAAAAAPLRGHGPVAA